MSELTLADERFERRSGSDGLALSPLQLVRTLRRNWLIILLCGLVFGAAAYVFTVTSVPKRYTTSGTVSVDLSRLAIPALQGALNGEALADPMPLVRSEVQILTSRALVQQVVEEQHLVQDPEFNSQLRPPPMAEQAKRWVSAHLPAAIATPAVNVGLLPDISKPDEPVPDAVIRDGVIGAVQHDLSIINDNRSLIIVVQFTATDPKVAANVVNSLVGHYIADKTLGRTEANSQANSELTRRVQGTRVEIDALEAKIAATRERYNLVQTRAGSVGQQQLEDLSSALTRASADRAQAVANYQRATTLAKTGTVSTDNATVLGSGTISTLRERESAAERRIALLGTTMGPGHPQLRAAQAELSSIRAALGAETQRVMGSLSAAADSATAREADLKRQLDAAQKAAGGLTAVQSELQQLEKDADSRRAIYQTLLQGEAQTASKDSASTPTGVRVVSSAVPPAYPTSPRPKVAGLLGMVSGVAFGGLVSLVGGRNKRGFAEPNDISMLTGITPAATIPRPAGGSLVARVVADPLGAEAESLRALRTRLRFSGRGAMPRSVLFVSSTDQEGAAEIAAAFARVAALDNVRTLLVEGDLPSPRLAGVLNVAGGNGLADVLLGNDHWLEQVQRDPQSPLDMLLATVPPPGATQLLESMQLQNLVSEAKEDYNLLVMNGQAVNATTQAMVLAHLLDAVVLVIGEKRSQRAAVREALATLGSASRAQPTIALNRAA